MPRAAYDMSQEHRVSLFRWWVLHPWRGWWASYGLLVPGAGLYALRLERTATILFVGAMVMWSASLVQGLRVSWHKARWKAILIVLVLFAGCLVNPIQEAVSSGDYARLDWQIVVFMVLFALFVVAAIITEYVVRLCSRRFATVDPRGPKAQ
jgi:hypothetical protein